MKSLAFKIAFGKKIGSGHLFRCSNISNNLKKKKIKTYLILKNKKQIQTLNFFYKNFDKIVVLENFNKEKNYLINNNIKNFFIDNKNIEYKKQQKYFKIVKKLIIYQDIPNKNFCSLIINHNFIPDAKKIYSRISKEKTKFFLGPEYYLINFKYNKIVKNEITIFLGGYPPINILLKMINAIKFLTLKNLKINIFIGYSDLRKFEIKKNILRKKINIYHLSSRKFFFRKINQSKIFVTSGGSSLIEGIFLNKLCVVLERAKNQNNNCKNFNKAGLIYLLNNKFSQEQFRRIILKSINKSDENILVRKNIKKFVKKNKKNNLITKLNHYLV